MVEAQAQYRGLYKTKRQKYELLRGQLELELASFREHWRMLNDYILPRRGRFFVSDVNKGDRRNLNIVDSTATFAVQALAAAMMSGVTSPSRPWFRLTTTDKDMAEYPAVKRWLHKLTERIATIFLQSNIYDSLPVAYGDMATFATAAMLIEEDFQDTIWTTVLPIGSYMIANNAKLEVEVFFRKFMMTVRQLVEKFGRRLPNGEIDWSNFSFTVQNLWKNKEFEKLIEVCHVIMPNEEYDPSRLQSKYKKYSSCYYEQGQGGPYQGSSPELDDRYLSEKGYDYFPVLAVRWEVTGEDVYGTNCPGMTMLGDVRALQALQKRKAQALEKQVNPPTQGPPEAEFIGVSILPGHVNYVRQDQGGLRPVHEVEPDIQGILLDIQDHQARINKACYVDILLMMLQSDKRDMTATEVDERKQEKMLALGRVLERLNKDLLKRLIDIVFEIMRRQGTFEPGGELEIPEELEGQPLKVEYLSVMAQAQKLVGLAGLERFTSFVMQLAETDPTAWDKVDKMELIDEVGNVTGVPPRILVPDEEVAEKQASRAKEAAAMQQAEMMKNASQGVKALSEADTQGQNALTDLARALPQVAQVA